MDRSILAILNTQIEELEGILLNGPTIEPKIDHTFSPGVYMRTMEMPAGSIIIGHMHKTDHINILLKGKISVVIDGELRNLSAPYIVVSSAGTRKVAYVHEDVVWANVHATSETDIVKLEEQLIQKSETFKRHEIEALASKQLTNEKS